MRVALVGFEADFYPDDDGLGVLEDMVKAAKERFVGWSKSVGRRLTEEKLQHFDIHFLCLPVPSVDKFREAFLDAMGR